MKGFLSFLLLMTMSVTAVRATPPDGHAESTILRGVQRAPIEFGRPDAAQKTYEEKLEEIRQEQDRVFKEQFLEGYDNISRDSRFNTVKPIATELAKKRNLTWAEKVSLLRVLGGDNCTLDTLGTLFDHFPPTVLAPLLESFFTGPSCKRRIELLLDSEKNGRIVRLDDTPAETLLAELGGGHPPLETAAYSNGKPESVIRLLDRLLGPIIGAKTWESLSPTQKELVLSFLAERKQHIPTLLRRMDGLYASEVADETVAAVLAASNRIWPDSKSEGLEDILAGKAPRDPFSFLEGMKNVDLSYAFRPTPRAEKLRQSINDYLKQTEIVPLAHAPTLDAWITSPSTVFYDGVSPGFKKQLVKDLQEFKTLAETLFPERPKEYVGEIGDPILKRKSLSDLPPAQVRDFIAKTVELNRATYGALNPFSKEQAEDAHRLFEQVEKTLESPDEVLYKSAQDFTHSVDGRKRDDDAILAEMVLRRRPSFTTASDLHEAFGIPLVAALEAYTPVFQAAPGKGKRDAYGHYLADIVGVIPQDALPRLAARLQGQVNRAKRAGDVAKASRLQSFESLVATAQKIRQPGFVPKTAYETRLAAVYQQEAALWGNLKTATPQLPPGDPWKEPFATRISQMLELGEVEHARTLASAAKQLKQNPDIGFNLLMRKFRTERKQNVFGWVNGVR